MKRLMTTCVLPLAAAVLLALPAPVVRAAGIERHAFPEPAPVKILEAATLPPGTETLLLSGRVALLPDASGQSAAAAVTAVRLGDTRRQTADVLAQIERTLERHGWKMTDVVRLTVYLVGDPAKGGKMDFAGMNQAYGEYFGSSTNPHLPTRSTVQVVALAHPAYLVEIEAMAARVAVRP